MATAIGLKLDVQKPEIQAVLTVSEDWFEFAVISLAGELVNVGGPIGSRSFVEDLRNHLVLTRQNRPEFSALEERIFSAGVHPQTAVMVPGWQAWAGRSELGRLTGQSFTPEEISLGIMPSLIRMTEQIKESIRLLPHEKQYELQRATLHATGRALKIPGLGEMIGKQIGVTTTSHPLDTHPSIQGVVRVLEEIKLLKKM